jgi:hypothetical protein
MVKSDEGDQKSYVRGSAENDCNFRPDDIWQDKQNETSSAQCANSVLSRGYLSTK